MSKRNSEGDVLDNKVAVAASIQRNFLESLLGGQSQAEPLNGTSNGEADNEDLDSANVDDESFGVGAIVPKDIADGSFTRRIVTSEDKLLQQLLGKKAAKAHLDAKQASKTNAKQTKPSKPQSIAVKEESEDEEEGRASAFKSKRRKVAKPSVKVEIEGEVADEPTTAGDCSTVKTEFKENNDSKVEAPEDDSGSEHNTQSTAKSRPSKSKPGSYLDEILAARSKKKKKKGPQTRTVS